MDPETILNEYMGAPNTPTVREAIRLRTLDMEHATRNSTAQNTNVFTTRNDALDASIMQDWVTEASRQFYSRANPLSEVTLNSDRHMDLSEYSRQYIFDYNDAFTSLQIDPPTPKMVNVSFVEITGNEASNDRPIQVMTGKMRVLEGQMRFFEDLKTDSIRDKMTDIIKKIMFPSVYASIAPRGQKWACQNPGKAVDTLKEMLDDIITDIVQSTFKLQNKLRNFQYIRG